MVREGVCLKRAGIWTLQAGIFPENEPSIALHRGIRQRVEKMTFGKLQGKWRDVVLMERRSQVAGID